LKHDFGSATDPGLVRRDNEDSLLAIELIASGSAGLPAVSLFAVADGIGGHAGGKDASRTALLILAQRAGGSVTASRKHGNAGQPRQDGQSLLSSWVREANRGILTLARGERGGMGTTLVSALLSGESAYVANVGDSRCYLFDGERLRQVTRDHSLVAGLVTAGDITLEEAAKHPQRNVVTRYLGERADVEVDVFHERLHPGAILMLCSDGLWETVPDRDIMQILRGPATSEIAATRLVEAAWKAGAPDNVSVIVVRVQE
jgi:serine/threonine protein phosphatase PrpC